MFKNWTIFLWLLKFIYIRVSIQFWYRKVGIKWKSTPWPSQKTHLGSCHSSQIREKWFTTSINTDARHLLSFICLNFIYSLIIMMKFIDSCEWRLKVMGNSDTMVNDWERGNSMSCTSCIIPVWLWLLILVVSIVQPGMVQLKAFTNTQMLFTFGAPSHNLLILQLLSPRTSFFVSTNNTSPSHFRAVKKVLSNQPLLTRRWRTTWS